MTREVVPLTDWQEVMPVSSVVEDFEPRTLEDDDAFMEALGALKASQQALEASSRTASRALGVAIASLVVAALSLALALVSALM